MTQIGDYKGRTATFTDEPVDGKYIGEQLRQAAELAGVELERPLHTLRHTTPGPCAGWRRLWRPCKQRSIMYRRRWLVTGRTGLTQAESAGLVLPVDELDHDNKELSPFRGEALEVGWTE